MKGAPNIAAELSVQERVLLFCLASGTEWAQAGVTGATASHDSWCVAWLSATLSRAYR
jgi:hypothetical protein